MSNQPANQPNPQLFFETINAYQRTAALKAAIELDLFSAIGKGNNTPESIATAIRIAPRGARILADYLTLLGFLTKSQGRYRLTPDIAAFLDRASPGYLGGAIEFLCAPKLRERFDDLTSAARVGGAPPADNTLDPDHDIWVRFARGMAPLMQMPAEALTKRVLADKPTVPIKVLDIAAGHGVFGIAIARHNPNARIVATDWANVLAVARENALKAGVIDRYQLLPGSAFDVDFGGDYDIVLLTNFLHHFNSGACTALLKRVRAALKPGGRALALEFVPNEDRVTPPPSAGFALVMLATTPQGDAYTAPEYEQMFNSAGFSRFECSNLEGTMQQVVTAHR
jgi:ubiquinone/menaquinone biosynthesis C-methylase UbiE